MTLEDWWAVLRRHRFAIDLQHPPRALVQTAFSVSNSINARIERSRFGFVNIHRSPYDVFRSRST